VGSYIKRNIPASLGSHTRQRRNFHDGISDRASRLTYVGGQEVVSRDFIFRPCVHILHFGAKMHRANGNILNVDFIVHVYT